MAYGLEQHIPSQINKNNVQTEFECLYQDILRSAPSISEDEKSTLKTKLRNTCEKYGRLKTPYKHEQTIRNLMNNNEILIMKQDKGRGVVIMNKDKYASR